MLKSIHQWCEKTLNALPFSRKITADVALRFVFEDLFSSPDYNYFQITPSLNEKNPYIIIVLPHAA